MDVSALKNGFGMWLVCGIMIVVIVVQALLYLRKLQEAWSALLCQVMMLKFFQ